MTTFLSFPVRILGMRLRRPASFGISAARSRIPKCLGRQLEDNVTSEIADPFASKSKVTPFLSGRCAHRKNFPISLPPCLPGTSHQTRIPDSSMDVSLRS